MSQGIFPFKYEAEKKTTGMTALPGLAMDLALARIIGLDELIERHLGVRKGSQGWTDSQMMRSHVLKLILIS